MISITPEIRHELKQARAVLADSLKYNGILFNRPPATVAGTPERFHPFTHRTELQQEVKQLGVDAEASQVRRINFLLNTQAGMRQILAKRAWSTSIAPEAAKKIYVATAKALLNLALSFNRYGFTKRNEYQGIMHALRKVLARINTPEFSAVSTDTDSLNEFAKTLLPLKSTDTVSDANTIRKSKQAYAEWIPSFPECGRFPTALTFAGDKRWPSRPQDNGGLSGANVQSRLDQQGPIYSALKEAQAIIRSVSFSRNAFAGHNGAMHADAQSISGYDPDILRLLRNSATSGYFEKAILASLGTSGARARVGRLQNLSRQNRSRNQIQMVTIDTLHTLMVIAIRLKAAGYDPRTGAIHLLPRNGNTLQRLGTALADDHIRLPDGILAQFRNRKDLRELQRSQPGLNHDTFKGQYQAVLQAIEKLQNLIHNGDVTGDLDSAELAPFGAARRLYECMMRPSPRFANQLQQLIPGIKLKGITDGVALDSGGFTPSLSLSELSAQLPQPSQWNGNSIDLGVSGRALENTINQLDQWCRQYQDTVDALYKELAGNPSTQSQLVPLLPQFSKIKQQAVQTTNNLHQLRINNARSRPQCLQVIAQCQMTLNGYDWCWQQLRGIAANNMQAGSAFHIKMPTASQAISSSAQLDIREKLADFDSNLLRIANLKSRLVQIKQKWCERFGVSRAQLDSALGASSRWARAEKTYYSHKRAAATILRELQHGENKDLEQPPVRTTRIQDYGNLLQRMEQKLDEQVIRSEKLLQTFQQALRSGNLKLKPAGNESDKHIPFFQTVNVLRELKPAVAQRSAIGYVAARLEYLKRQYGDMFVGYKKTNGRTDIQLVNNGALVQQAIDAANDYLSRSGNDDEASRVEVLAQLTKAYWSILRRYLMEKPFEDRPNLVLGDFKGYLQHAWDNRSFGSLWSSATAGLTRLAQGYNGEKKPTKRDSSQNNHYNRAEKYDIPLFVGVMATLRSAVQQQPIEQHAVARETLVRVNQELDSTVNLPEQWRSKELPKVLEGYRTQSLEPRAYAPNDPLLTIINQHIGVERQRFIRYCAIGGKTVDELKESLDKFDTNKEVIATLRDYELASREYQRLHRESGTAATMPERRQARLQAVGKMKAMIDLASKRAAQVREQCAEVYTVSPQDDDAPAKSVLKTNIELFKKAVQAYKTAAKAHEANLLQYCKRRGLNKNTALAAEQLKHYPSYQVVSSRHDQAKALADKLMEEINSQHIVASAASDWYFVAAKALEQAQRDYETACNLVKQLDDSSLDLAADAVGEDSSLDTRLAHEGLAKHELFKRIKSARADYKALSASSKNLPPLQLVHLSSEPGYAQLGKKFTALRKEASRLAAVARSSGSQQTTLATQLTHWKQANTRQREALILHTQLRDMITRQQQLPQLQQSQVSSDGIWGGAAPAPGQAVNQYHEARRQLLTRVSQLHQQWMEVARTMSKGSNVVDGHQQCLRLGDYANAYSEADTSISTVASLLQPLKSNKGHQLSVAQVMQATEALRNASAKLQQAFEVVSASQQALMADKLYTKAATQPDEPLADDAAPADRDTQQPGGSPAPEASASSLDQENIPVGEQPATASPRSVAQEGQEEQAQSPETTKGTTEQSGDATPAETAGVAVEAKTKTAPEPLELQPSLAQMRERYTTLQPFLPVGLSLEKAIGAPVSLEARPLFQNALEDARRLPEFKIAYKKHREICADANFMAENAEHLQNNGAIAKLQADPSHPKLGSKLTDETFVQQILDAQAFKKQLEKALSGMPKTAAQCFDYEKIASNRRGQTPDRTKQTVAKLIRVQSALETLASTMESARKVRDNCKGTMTDDQILIHVRKAYKAFSEAFNGVCTDKPGKDKIDLLPDVKDLLDNNRNQTWSVALSEFFVKVVQFMRSLATLRVFSSKRDVEDKEVYGSRSQRHVLAPLWKIEQAGLKSKLASPENSSLASQEKAVPAEEPRQSAPTA